jgi:hypothetical protein
MTVPPSSLTVFIELISISLLAIQWVTCDQWVISAHIRVIGPRIPVAGFSRRGRFRRGSGIPRRAIRLPIRVRLLR